MTRVPVNGVALNVEQMGHGSPLLLLHGFTGSSDTWSPFASSLGEGFELIAVDLLGHGASDSPRDPGRYRMARAVDDLRCLIDRLGFAQVAVLGYSMGGRIALHLALAAAERVTALVVESTSAGIRDPTERAARRRYDGELADMIERDGLEAFVARWEHQPLFASQTRLPAATQTALQRQRLRNNPAGLAGSLRGAGAGEQESLWERLPEVRSPTLLIAGDQDEKYRNLACQMVDILPAATLAIIPESGHAAHLEQPEAFEHCVVAFLARYRTKRGGASRPESGRTMGAASPSSLPIFMREMRCG